MPQAQEMVLMWQRDTALEGHRFYVCGTVVMLIAPSTPAAL